MISKALFPSASIVSASGIVDNILESNEMGTIAPKTERQTREIAKAPQEEQLESI